MSKYLLSSAQIIDTQNPFHLQKKDILIENGRIVEMADKLSHDAETVLIFSENLCVSIGFLDMRCHIPDLGFEYKETLQTARNAALAGGFTEICALPNMHPPLDTKNSLFYIHRENAQNIVQIHPIAAITLKTAGEDLSDMIDLHGAGAIAFSDGLQATQNPDILLKSLQYLQHFGGLLLQRPEDTLITQYGQMHEGVVATLLGLRGMPALSEILCLQRDIEILRYTGGKIHFSCISSAQSVQIIEVAKKEGLQVSCDVAAHQLFFTEEALQDFDTNFKVNPPLRAEEDRKALWEGLATGVIDAIVSDHQPQDTENKLLEFDLAAFGAIGLETTWAASNTLRGDMPLTMLIEKLTTAPRRILSLAQPRIGVGEMANLCVFDSKQAWVYEKIVSRSKNSPFVGKTLIGKIRAVFNNGMVYYDAN